MSYEYTNPGKGKRAHRNVSTRDYRDGWEAIYGKRGLPEEKRRVCRTHSTAPQQARVKAASPGKDLFSEYL